MKIKDIRKKFIQIYKNNLKYKQPDTLEIINASFIADEPSIFGTVNYEYIRAELQWYLSQSLNVNDLYHGRKKVPEAWKRTANKDGKVNSNYGYLIFSEEQHKQYSCALSWLLDDPQTRRAVMVYNRPSIHWDYNDDMMDDYICTNAVQYYIRNGKMDCVVQMRSNDAVIGYRNDYAWQKFVLEQLCTEYNQLASIESGQEINVKVGTIYWNVANIHVYQRNYNLIEKELEK